MKNIEIIFLFILCFNYSILKIEVEGGELIEDPYQIKISNIITKNVSFGGFLFLQTDGFVVFSTEPDEEEMFNLSIINDEDKSTYSLICFFYNRDILPIGAGKIACNINSKNIKKLGKYYLEPIENDKNREIYNNLTIAPSVFNESFNIIEGEEFYFYSKEKQKLYFSTDTDTKTIKFKNYEKSIKKEVIYLEDIPINCQSSGEDLYCTISAKELPQDKRFQTLNVFIKDSHGNKKENYFAYPIDITLEYIDKKTLKIKVTKQLTNCLINKDFIILETSDNTLENMIYSNEGFNLRVKNEESNNIGELFCGFHKHPGENTKIYCEVEKKLEDGYYTFEEYISEGPLEGEKHIISLNYNVVIPSFKLNGRFIYSSNRGSDELIFDILFRDKIYLNYKNKGEIFIIALFAEHYEGNYEYFLGNSKLEYFHIGRDNLAFKIPSINFEKSGIYYFEKKNFLEERQRIYMVPPFEVIFSWE